MAEVRPEMPCGRDGHDAPHPSPVPALTARMGPRG